MRINVAILSREIESAVNDITTAVGVFRNLWQRPCGGWWYGRQHGEKLISAASIAEHKYCAEYLALQ